MEDLENYMVMPEIDKYYDTIPDEIWSDMESNAYDDMIFEEMTEQE